MNKPSQIKIKRELELRNFLYRISELFNKGQLNFADCCAIALRKYTTLYPEIAELWPTYFPKNPWLGELSNVADCRVLYCPGCDMFKGIEYFEYRANAKLTRSRLCNVCLDKWRLDRKKGKLPFQQSEKKYGPQPRKVYERKGYEGRKLPPKPQIPKDNKQ